MSLLAKILKIGLATEPLEPGDAAAVELVRQVEARTRRLLGRALAIRQIDAGSCNGCELEISGLTGPVYDVERFGVHFVASPRHADLLLVTGPVTRNMEVPLRKTYEATPDPKLVVAVGDCAKTCGVFRGSYAVAGSVDQVVPVDVFVAGCPPEPADILRGILAALDRLPGPSLAAIGMSLTLPLFLAMVLGHVAGAGGALLAPTRAGARGLTTLGAIVGGAAGLVLGLDTLIRGTPFRLEIPQLLAMAGGVSLHLDRLGAFFLVVVEVVAIPSALFGGAYSRVYEGTHSLRLLGVMLNLFLLALGLVPLADNVVTFLLLWELMSVASYFLVLTESDQRESRQAGLWYLAMAHGGLVLLMAAFLLLAASAPSTGFADLRTAAAALPAYTRNAVFLLVLLGFGSKAGLVPLHVWLPLAHPAAPSHVSALMSGVMIKMGVYGLLRVALDLLGGGPPWWGGTILAAGAVSAVLGVLYALMEHDLKRLLAYHSVENIGIIFLGIGAGMMFQSYGLTALALLGLVAGLYHTVNHACFKGLLFLGSGAVLHATHTRNMEELGGLIKRMPRTALCFLVGAVAISGLPPLNGFVSEWLVFQALLGGPQLPRPELGLIMAFAVAMLALTSGLAAACFVKAFGITFLAMPRSVQAAQAREVPLTMQLGMGVLAFACVALGVLPSFIVPVLGSAVGGLGGLPADLATEMPGLTLEMPGSAGVIAPAAVAAGLVLVSVAVGVAFRLGAADRRLRVGDTWGCGRIGQTPRMEYTATAFAEPLRRVFAELYRPTEDLSIDFHPESRYFVQSIAYRSEVHPWFERLLYAPVVSFLRRTAFRVRWLQAGSLHLYLLYMILALVLLLLVSRWPS